jgi:hypothetical protein
VEAAVIACQRSQCAAKAVASEVYMERALCEFLAEGTVNEVAYTRIGVPETTDQYQTNTNGVKYTRRIYSVNL